MKHIRYISDNKTLCTKPQRLGHDFVVIDTSSDPDERSCVECSDLLFAHNMEEYRKEGLLSKGVMYIPPMEPEDDPLSAARGCLIGLAVSSAFWLTMFLIYWFGIR